MQKNTTLTILLLIFISVLAPAQNQLTNLPSIFITTTNKQPVVDKVNWVPGKIIIKSNDSTEVLNMSTEIRGRGNSTWNMPKKPYRIKLGSKTNLLNLPAKEKNWVLLANYADKTLIRNAVAFKISNIIGLKFSPSARFADLTLNDQFLGNYMITDQLEVNPLRVDIDIPLVTDTLQPSISGGYFLEIDGFAADEPLWFTTDKGLKITVKTPDSDKIVPAQLNYIKNYIADFENRLFSENYKDPITGYRSKVDTTSLVNWYLGCELTGNSDSFWSTYIYKKRADEKLYFGPMWDYDIAFNNNNRLGDVTEKLMSQVAFSPRTWIEQLLTDKWFQEAVWRRWQEIESNNLLGTLNTYINDTQTLINTSQQNNFKLWNILNTRVYNETYLFSTYGEGVDYLKTYLSKRIAFLNTKLKTLGDSNPSVPFVTSNNYFMILNKGTNNAIDVKTSSLIANASLVMWEPAEEDMSQLWEIKSLSNGLFRIENRNSGLAIAGNGYNKGLTQVSVNDQDNTQKWKITPVNTGGFYGIIDSQSVNAIDNSGGSFANGNSVITWTNDINNNVNQQWYFQKMDMILTEAFQPGMLSEQIQLYPNPAKENVSIRFGLNEPQKITINITDIAGNQKYKLDNNLFESGNQVFTIPLSGNFVSGVYFVTLSNSLGEKTSMKLIVKP